MFIGQRCGGIGACNGRDHENVTPCSLLDTDVSGDSEMISSVLMMEGASIPETLEYIYHNSRRRSQNTFTFKQVLKKFVLHLPALHILAN